MPSDDDLDAGVEKVAVNAHGDEGYWSCKAIENGVSFPLSSAGRSGGATGVRSTESVDRRNTAAFQEIRDTSAASGPR